MANRKKVQLYDYYTELEPNHTVDIDSDGYQLVMCPYINPDTNDPFCTPWAPTAGPEEVNCLFCEYLNEQYQELPEHGIGDATS